MSESAILFRVLSVLVLLTLLCFLVAELVPVLQYNIRMTFESDIRKVDDGAQVTIHRGIRI